MRPQVPSLVEESISEHLAMFRRIIELRDMQPGFDAAVRALKDKVAYHVEEEERSLLPQAERMPGPTLHELGAQMTERRLKLAKPLAGKVVSNAARALPGGTLGLAAALLAGALLLRKALRH